MPIYRGQSPVSYGGRPLIRVVSNNFGELKKFLDKWDGSFAYADPKVQRAIAGELTKRERDALAVHALHLRWSCPGAKVGLTTTREPIQVLVEATQIEFLKNQKIPVLQDKYIPVLNMIMREQFARTCPGGFTNEMRHFYEVEIRGKVIQLIKSLADGVMRSEHPSIEILNAQLEKIDLGRRSDLNYWQNAVLDTLNEGSAPTDEPVEFEVETLPEKPLAPSGRSFSDFKRDQGLQV